jgi:nitroimidazol reductase NimA-like FMN-containing flavoprotein (pyridoxamine 5'-phosphate oxidase superfamily)
VGAATDRHGLEVLPLAQCLVLLRSRPIGRLAFVEAGLPTVLPVNHLVDSTSVVLRTTRGGKLDAALAGKPVAFQLDDHDEARGTGWSVLVRGRIEVVDDPELLARYAEELDSWLLADGEEAAWLRIVADEVSGRRLRRSTPSE